ncbi:transcriptional regulator [Agaricicola taiwanensis]|uniref:Transcriptional regulator n=1 Tax=Agaricicola taiwanensis TaxID=591372 RepID=A0A8J2VIT9_9RHOB|nr:cupin domain-containing protein [Agaricicola taiwanensis]GGE32180.1 transcriptional regulator [Agaricicola taiwanensis]
MASTTSYEARSVADLWLGQQIRQTRKKRGLSISDLSKQCGMSVGLVSQIERGISSPSVRALRLISEALEIPSSALLKFGDAPASDEKGIVSRANSHPTLNNPEKGIEKVIVTPQPSAGINVYRAFIEPGGSTGEELFTIERGEQVGLVLTGQLELWIEDKCFTLKPGDSFRYHSKTPHRWRNPGDTRTEVIWVVAAVALINDK